MDYNYQETSYMGQPSDYKTWSIINLVVSILFCCSCTGIVSLVLSIIALVKSNEVSSQLMAGEAGLFRAREASKLAKTLNIISSILLAIGFITSLAYIIAFGLTDFAKAMQPYR